ncbi:MAG: energy-coupling factor transporter transmembrane protein EcfT [Asgard group archaeon]|nr:energy-coupling factor transporter transmembrane protein EcfT [Asgard group archaeon]
MSLRILEFFNYESKKSFMHRVDPRAKAIFVIVMTCITILFREFVPLAIVLAAIIPLIFLSNFFKKWLKTLLMITPLILLIILLNSLILKEVDVVTPTSLLKEVTSPTTVGIAMGLRFIILTTTFGIFFQTVSPDDISQMFVKMKFPYSFAWAISTAYRFVPTIAKEASTIAAAQKARGLQIDRGNIFKRLRNMLPLLIPIFASAMRRSWQLAEAMESRGWNAIKKRTFLYSMKFKWWDYLVILFSLVLFALFLTQAIKQYQFPDWMLWELPDKLEIRRLLTIVWHWLKGLFSK